MSAIMCYPAPDAPFIGLTFYDARGVLELTVGDRSISIPFAALRAGVTVGEKGVLTNGFGGPGEVALTLFYDELVHISAEVKP